MAVDPMFLKGYVSSIYTDALTQHAVRNAEGIRKGSRTKAMCGRHVDVASVKVGFKADAGVVDPPCQTCVKAVKAALATAQCGCPPSLCEGGFVKPEGCRREEGNADAFALIVGDPVNGIRVYAVTGPDDPRIEQHFANETWWVVPIEDMPVAEFSCDWCTQGVAGADAVRSQDGESLFCSRYCADRAASAGGGEE